MFFFTTIKCRQLVLLILFSVFMSIYGQSDTGSPCPHLFKYKTRYDSYRYGVLSIPSPQHDESTVTVIALFTLRSRLPTKYGGLMELLGTREETIRDLQEYRPIRFLIHFPVQSPMPKLKLISYNNFILCGNTENDLFMMRRPFMNIEFRYTFNITGLVDSTGDYVDVMEGYQKEQQQNVQSIFSMATTPPPSTTAVSRSPDPECGHVHRKFQISPLIAGGELVKRGSWPWLVAIYLLRPAGPMFICAGNLMSPTVVVTSAYCFRTSDTEYKSNEILIYLGRHDMNNWMEKGSVIRTASSIHFPVAYKAGGISEYDGDISVVVLQSEVTFSEYIQPICLWEGSTDDMIGMSGIVVGWGSDRNGMAITQTPKSISIPIVESSVCKASNELFKTIQSNSTFCAGFRDGKGPCHGDSGGGFAVVRGKRMILKGLVSGALAGPLNICDLSNYVVFTDVAHYRDWINTFL